jgi:hypothetical protein
MDHAAHAVDQAKQNAGQVVDQMREQASNRLVGQIGQTSEGLHSASEALRSVGQQLRQNAQAPAPIAQYADKAADQVERVSTYLRDKDLDRIVDDVERFARHNPATFIGGAFALGLLASRFLKSTPEQRTSMIDATGQWNRDHSGSTWNQSHPTTPGTTPTSPRSTSFSAETAPTGTNTPPSWATPGSTGTGSSTTSPSTMPSAQQSATPNLPQSNARVTHPGETPSQPGGLTDQENSGWRQSA